MQLYFTEHFVASSHVPKPVTLLRLSTFSTLVLYLLLGCELPQGPGLQNHL